MVEPVTAVVVKSVDEIPAVCLEDDLIAIFKHRAEENQSKLTVTYPKDITDEEMRRFGYIEHPSNVALALKVCEHIGVDRETALDARFWKAVQEMVVRAAEALREMKVKGKKRGKK